MTDNEFREWVRYHDAAFPGWRAWAGTIYTASDDPPTAERDSLTARRAMWLNRLRNLTLQQACEGTQALLNASVDLAFGKHIGWIVEASKTDVVSEVTNWRTCGLCNDTGIVSVRFFSDRKTYGGNPLPDNIGQAACKCNAGMRMNHFRGQSHDGSQMENFDSSHMEIFKLPPVDRSAISERMRTSRTATGRGLSRLANVIDGLGLGE